MTSVLVLNKNFYAVAVTGWQRALSLLYLNRAIVVDEAWRIYDFETWICNSEQITEEDASFVHTPSFKIAVPEVIALKIFGEVPMREVTFTRKNIFSHYGFRCCYCAHPFPSDELNLDHIMPRSRGGVSAWSNVVPSCIPCNKRKGSRLPKEAGMKLALLPSRPKARPGAAVLLQNGNARQTWRQFLDKGLRRI